MFEKDILVKTSSFDGPLALLLYLVQRQEIDVKNLEITLITEQYLSYLSQVKEPNFDFVGDYLLMAATLLYLKSKSFVTEDGSEEKNVPEAEEHLIIKSRSELIKRLEELEKFQRLSKLLWSRNKLGHEVFTRTKNSRKVIFNSLMSSMDLNELVLIMADFLAKEKSKLTYKRDPYSVKDKVLFLCTYLKIGQTYRLREIIDNDIAAQAFGLQHIVVSFASLLELARLKKITIFQDSPLGEIYFEVIAQILDSDVHLIEQSENETEELSKNEEKIEIEIPKLTNEQNITYIN